jgi:acetyltransferase-like isoleucine patch superfamily enzyme
MLSRFLRIISQSRTRAWLREFTRKNPQVQIGENLRLMGQPIFDVAPDACLKIGPKVTMISLPEGNLAGLSKRCSIGVEPGAKLTIGESCGFSGVSIYCALEISIGSHLTCGANVSIWDTDFHPLDAQARRANDRSAIQRKAVIIGDDVFLGANVLVLKGARIGDRAIIGAGSVVTGTVPPDEIWAGNPARFLRRCESKETTGSKLS